MAEVPGREMFSLETTTYASLVDWRRVQLFRKIINGLIAHLRVGNQWKIYGGLENNKFTVKIIRILDEF